MSKFEVGQIVRHDKKGISALMRLTTRRDIRGGHYQWYGIHVMGGSWGADEEELTRASEADLEFARAKRPEWFNTIPAPDLQAS